MARTWLLCLPPGARAATDGTVVHTLLRRSGRNADAGGACAGQAPQNMRPHLMHACARGPNPHVRHSRAAMFANGLRHFTHCCAAGPKPHELQSCAGVSANGAPHAMHWDAFGPKPQVAQRWAEVDMGAGYRGRAPDCP